MKRDRLVGLAIAMAALGIPGVAAAGWAPTIASGSAGAASASLIGTQSAPSTSADPSTSLQVNLSWSPAALVPSGPNATSFEVLRYTVPTGGTATKICGSSAGPIAVTSCSDTTPAPSTYYYSVVPHFQGWIGTESLRTQATSVQSAPQLRISSVAANGGNKATFSGVGGANGATITVYVCTSSGGCSSTSQPLLASATTTVVNGAWTATTSQNVNTSGTTYYAQAYQTSPSAPSATSSTFGPFHCSGNGSNQTCTGP